MVLDPEMGEEREGESEGEQVAMVVASWVDRGPRHGAAKADRTAWAPATVATVR